MRASLLTRGLWSLGIALLARSALAQVTPPAAAPAAEAAPASSSSLSAGGLAPPPALETAPAPGVSPATPAATELTVSLYILGLAVGQLLYGPASDRFGRRPALLVGLYFLLRKPVRKLLAKMRPASRRVAVSSVAGASVALSVRKRLST